MSKQRYALWVHVLDKNLKTRLKRVIKFWGFDTDDEAEKELLKKVNDEAAKKGVFLVEYRIRRESDDDPFTQGIVKQLDPREID